MINYLLFSKLYKYRQLHFILFTLTSLILILNTQSSIVFNFSSSIQMEESLSQSRKRKEKVIPNLDLDDSELTDDEPKPFPTTETKKYQNFQGSRYSFKSSIFTKHYEKIPLPYEEMHAKCIYCNASYKFQSDGS